MSGLAQHETIDPGGREVDTDPGDGSGETRAIAKPKGRPRIGKYEVVKLLGRGGMGAVYQAFDPFLERDVALKVMLPETAGDPEHKQRFEREARAVARLSHPGIVTVFDLGYHTDGSPYIVMELLKGQDLLARLRQSPPLSLEDKVRIVTQVLEGLGHAHQAGIVHRDVKPANVFLTEEGAARIMDFGIAFWTASGGTSKSVLGTVSYMSPEQVRGERVDGRSDLFSVGTLLYEVLTGRRPFDAETPMATFHRIARGQASLDLPPGPEYAGFRPVLQRALAVAVEERYPTAAEFAAALRGCLRADSPEVVAVPAARRPLAVPAVERATPAGPVRRADPGPLFRLLREVYVGGKSGHLHLAVDGERKSLRVRRGQIVHGSSDTAGEHLGDVLVRYGLISQEDLDRALAIVLRERRRLGAVLMDLGLLDRSRVEEAVGIHAREILFNGIGRPGISCSFEELAESLLETDLVCPLSTGQLILEATRRILDPDLVRTVLGDLGRVLVLSADPVLRAQKITLTPADGFVLSRVDGRSSARDVLALIPQPAEEAERSLFSLLCTGIVGYQQDATSTSRRRIASPLSSVTPPPRPAVTPSAAAFTGRAASTPLPAAPLDSASRVAPPAPVAEVPAERPARVARDAEEIRSLILETHARLRRDHFEVLGLERTATEAEVREAYAGFARILHPDVCRDGLEDLREERDAVFIRLTAAYEVLRDPASRAAYERAYEPSKLPSPRPRVKMPGVTPSRRRPVAPRAARASASRACGSPCGAGGHSRRSARAGGRPPRPGRPRRPPSTRGCRRSTSSRWRSPCSRTSGTGRPSSSSSRWSRGPRARRGPGPRCSSPSRTSRTRSGRSGPKASCCPCWRRTPGTSTRTCRSPGSTAKPTSPPAPGASTGGFSTCSPGTPRPGPPWRISTGAGGQKTPAPAGLTGLFRKH